VTTDLSWSDQSPLFSIFQHWNCWSGSNTPEKSIKISRWIIAPQVNVTLMNYLAL